MSKDLEYIWDEKRDDVLFYGNAYDLEELHSVLNNCHDVLRKSKSGREMVMETWLSIDFSIRQFLLSGFDLSRFCDEDFDLKYMLLPNTFSALLRLFQRTIKYNSKFCDETDQLSTEDTGSFKASIALWKYVKEKHGELFEKIIEVQKEYNVYKHPELKDLEYPIIKPASIFLEPGKLERKRPLEKMNQGWRCTACKFDESWFKKAEQLSYARNEAAHSVDAAKIGTRFGLSQPNMLEKIRGKCLEILNVLLAVKTDA